MGQSQSSATIGTSRPERLCLRTQDSCPCLDGLLGVPGATGAWTDGSRRIIQSLDEHKGDGLTLVMSASAGCSQRPVSLLVAVLPAFSGPLFF